MDASAIESITTTGSSRLSTLQFFINGKLVTEEQPDPNQVLSHYIREKLGLTGTKVACGVGGCGSCTVILSKYNPSTKEFAHSAVNSCITALCSIHGYHVLTVEGLSGPNTCHVIQDAIARGNGTQCGFCTPGMVMSFHGLKHQNESPNTHDIKTALQGNLCRCTGYRPILEAFQNCSDKCSMSSDSMDIENIPQCMTPQIEDKKNVSSEPAITFTEIEKLLDAFHNVYQQFEEKQFRKNESLWLRPKSVSDLKQLLANYPNAKITAGHTESVLVNESTNTPFISIGRVPELRIIENEAEGIRFGSMVSINEMVQYLELERNLIPASASRIFDAIIKLMQFYGSVQIRNAATLGGSLATNNVASDFQTAFVAFGCTAQITDRNCDDTGVQSTSNFPISPSAVIVNVTIPISKEGEYAWAYKISKRKYNDGAIVNTAVLAIVEEGESTSVKKLSVAVGGKALNRFHLIVVPESSKGKLSGIVFAELFMGKVLEKVRSSIKEHSDFSTDYVMKLAKKLCIKFYQWFRREVLGKNEPTIKMDVEQKATRLFSSTEKGDYSANDLVGKPQPHASAYKHATGQAQYLDDIPKFSNELALELVLSTRAHAHIKSVHLEKCLNTDGVVGFISHQDLPSEGQNLFGVIVEDEEVFASEKVYCVGQTILGIVAKNPEIAKKAAKLVEIEYEDIQPCILTMNDAIKHKSFYTDFNMVLEKGNCSKVLSTSENMLTDFIHMGGQEHFYLEPQGCLAIPNGEDGEMTVISSAQHPTEVQNQVAKRLGVPANRITVKVKRVGGGFGGKETRSLLVALPVAVAAQKFGKPVRAILDRQTDMLISGKRTPYQVNYTIAFTPEGKIKALVCKVYCDGGCSLDASPASIERALINLDNGYFLPNVKFEGFICKTNLPSNTVFRGTGAPQAAYIMERIIDGIALYLNKDPVEIRRLNMYSEGDETPYGQVLVNSTVRKCWEECLRLSRYHEQKAEVDDFNRTNVWVKRGVSINPGQYGISFTALSLNQAGALVNIYKDGSVVVNHGGVELGQGLHTKMIQVATRELRIPASKIRIVETSTDKVPNTAPTAGSCSSDLNGMAVMYACQELMKRLDVYFKEDPNTSWENIITKAFSDRVSLSATGFYKTPNIGWKEVMKGEPFSYFCTGAACTTVEVDCLTGQHRLLRTDIVMDVGNSLNPSIDIGQIEGAYMQGVGLFTIEELKYSSSGELKTTGPGTYKIPCIADTPLEFNVSLLSNSPNPRAIYSSKAVGEPPLLLATSAFFAIKDAIEAYRRSVGFSMEFELSSPATIEKILLACCDEEVNETRTKLELTKML